jgi:hypothetical protein
MSTQQDRKIDLSNLKRDFASRFPNNPLTPVLLSEPDTVGFGDLLAKAGTWLVLLGNDKRSKER